jgi:uncharacterized membrane protein YvbJ
MYCPKCGEQTPEGSNFCQKCGAALTTQPASLDQSLSVLETERTSGLAVASLVLGIVSFGFNPLAVLAIIFGAVAMSQTRKNPNLRGRGMAVAGLVLGIVVTAVWIIIIIWLGSVFWLFGTSSTSTVFS